MKDNQYYEDRLFYRRRLALSILLELKKEKRKVEIMDSTGIEYSIDEAIEVVRSEILNDALKESDLKVYIHEKSKAKAGKIKWANLAREKLKKNIKMYKEKLRLLYSAKKDFDEAIRLNPNASEFFNNRAKCLMSISEYEANLKFWRNELKEVAEDEWNTNREM